MIDVAMRHPVFICMILLSLSAWHVQAATRTTTVTEIKRGKNVEKRTEVLTIDNDNARLDIYSGVGSYGKKTAYFLTNDGGKTWQLNDVQNGKWLCSHWNTRQVFAHVGELIHYAAEFVNAYVSEGKFDVRLDEPGPEMFGHTTRHMKIDYSINAKASFLFFSREYTLSFEDEIWTSPDLTLSPIEQAWVNEMGNTGYKKLDRLTRAWNRHVQGTVLKQISDVTMHNVTKNEKDVKRETFTVTKLETLKPGVLATELFKAQECKKASEEEMEEAAKKMLKELAK